MPNNVPADSVVYPGQFIPELAALAAPFDRLCFIDLETSGTRPTRDRITEIAAVPVDAGVVGTPLVTLIDPGVRIPEVITRLTGIDNPMLAGAPVFSRIAPELAALLDGRLLVAHNARFDSGFLHNAYKRLGLNQRLDSLCTVKLSRKLDPQYRRHNLDSLIGRHQLKVTQRHRAWGDAAVLPLLLARWCQNHGTQAVLEALKAQRKALSLPPNLDPQSLQDLPERPGVYRFYGTDGAVLYIGKSVNLYQRVRSHFTADRQSDREMRINQQTVRIDWTETPSEFGALLREAREVKKHQPVFNRRLRPQRALLTLYWRDDATPPQVVALDEIEPTALGGCHGVYRSRQKAREMLKNLARAHRLCPQQLGLEKGQGRCFARQLGHCAGLCEGAEPEIAHRMRLKQALAPKAFDAWPYSGPVMLEECNAAENWCVCHYFDQWRYLGSADAADAHLEPISQVEAVSLDIDLYKLAVDGLLNPAKFKAGVLRVHPLPA